MKLSRWSMLGLSMVLTILGVLWSQEAAAQRRGGVGTAQGDILRGQAAYMVGAGWYNLNTARANNINVDTWKKHNMEVQRLYRSYLQERYSHSQGRKKLTEGVEAAWQKKFEEDQRRWRESPTTDDISSGNALNIMASDLADPTIAPTSWGSAEVKLPIELSLNSLAFKIADKKTASIFQSTVAMDRLLIAEGWPIWLRRPELKREQAAYEQAVKTVVDKCRTETPLEASDVDKLRSSVVTLQQRVPEVVPGRDNQRARAIEYVSQLDGATRIFAEQTYAERLIKDVSEHKAESVAELLGFMRYHRLLFADPGKSPDAIQRYEGLYQLLREQKAKLGIADVPAGGLAAVAPSNEVPTAAGFWTLPNRAAVLLRPDGKVLANRNEVGSWQQDGRTLTLRLSGPNTKKAGNRVLTVTLSPDGQKYEGKGQRGATISGERLPGPPAGAPKRKGRR